MPNRIWVYIRPGNSLTLLHHRLLLATFSSLRSEHIKSKLGDYQGVFSNLSKSVLHAASLEGSMLLQSVPGGKGFFLNNGQPLHSEICDLRDRWALQDISKRTCNTSLESDLPILLHHLTT